MSRAMMICEDVNVFAAKAEAQPPPNMTRAEMICEDANYLRGSGEGGGEDSGDGELFALLSAVDGSLFCVPASALHSVPVPGQQPPVWPNPPLSVPSELETDPIYWNSGNGPRLPVRFVRRGVGGLTRRETGGCSCTAFPDGKKCLFKRDFPSLESSIICAGMRGLTWGVMRQQQDHHQVEQGHCFDLFFILVRFSRAPALIRPPPEADHFSSGAFSSPEGCQCSEQEQQWGAAPGATPPLFLPGECNCGSDQQQIVLLLPPSGPHRSTPSPSSSPYSDYSPQGPFPCKASPPPACGWKHWVDKLVHEVRAEINAEQMFSGTTVAKRKISSLSSSLASPCYSYSSASPAPSSIPSCPSPVSGFGPPPTKRAKKNSLLTLTHEQMAERKKEQNRAAAQRYRSRKTSTLEHERTEINILESRNAEMRAEQKRLETEIAQLRAQLLSSKDA